MGASRASLGLSLGSTSKPPSGQKRLSQPLGTDLGPEFKGAFRHALRRAAVVQRFRRKGYVAGTARLESFWRTLKNIADLRLPMFLTLEDLERRLAPALTHYTYYRPHRGLHGATPVETFLAGLDTTYEVLARSRLSTSSDEHISKHFLAHADLHRERWNQHHQ